MKRICEICNRNCGDEDMQILNDQKICMKCYDLMQAETISLTIPQNIVWISKIAKMGKYRRIIEIPKKQKGLLKLDKHYLVILKEAE